MTQRQHFLLNNPQLVRDVCGIITEYDTHPSDGFEVGDYLDAMDGQGRYYMAVVTKKTPQRLYIHYCGWSGRWDRWYVTGKCASILHPLGTKTQSQWCTRSFKKGEQLYLRMDYSRNWNQIVTVVDWSSMFVTVRCRHDGQIITVPKSKFLLAEFEGCLMDCSRMEKDKKMGAFFVENGLIVE